MEILEFPITMVLISLSIFQENPHEIESIIFVNRSV